MKQYIKLTEDILKNGSWKPAARENMPDTIGLFGYQFRHNLLDGFPLLTTKEVSFKNIWNELRWVLRGDTHIKFLIDNNCNIWNEDAFNYYNKVLDNYKGEFPPTALLLEMSPEGSKDIAARRFTFEEFVKCIKTTDLKTLKEKYSIINYTLGDCGKQYGWLWRSLKGTTTDDVGNTDTNYYNIDQLADVVKSLINNPFGRRHIIDAWNPSTLDQMALHPCHALVQFNVRQLSLEDREDIRRKLKLSDKFYIPELILDCQMYQRSADTFLGVPYNIGFYSLLTILLANMLGMVPGDFIHSFGDVHIYRNHISQMTLQLSRKPKPLPFVKSSQGLTNLINSLRDCSNPELKADLIIEALSSLEEDDMEISNYSHHPKIQGKLSTGLK